MSPLKNVKHYCFTFPKYRLSLFKHVFYLSTSFRMPDANNEQLEPLMNDWLHLGIWCKILPS